MIREKNRILALIVVVAMTLSLLPITAYAKADVDTIDYTMDGDDTQEFYDKDFNTASKDATGKTLDYITFSSLPSSSTGKLYYKYKKSAEEKIEKSTEYYYGSKPAISDITFVPHKDFSGTATISYKGYDTNGKSFTGDIKIKVSGNSDKSTVFYSVDSKSVVGFEEKDFNTVSKAKNSRTLDYVKFTALPKSSAGTLYYKYGKKTESEVGKTEKYYYDSTPSLADVTFVPERDYSGTVSFKFQGTDINGDTFTGEVQIAVGLGDAKKIEFTVDSDKVLKLDVEKFNDASKGTNGAELDYIIFSRPASTRVTLYYEYDKNSSAPTEINFNKKYFYSESPYLSKITFVPAEGISNAGTFELEYEGCDVKGREFSGNIKINIVYKEPTTPTPTTPTVPTTPLPGTTVRPDGTIDYSNLPVSKYFVDVDQAYSWGVPYVDGLYETGIISGTLSTGNKRIYEPDKDMTRGDFMLILFRALKLQSNTSAGNFKDVTSGSYYYEAIATAKALGIATGSEENKFYPNDPITREDAMVLVLRTVNITGTTIPAADVSLLSSYTDVNQVSDYAKSAVAALVNAKVITGSDDNRLYPQGKLSRIQVAAIISRLK